jgi:2-polyprenyl-3-methyl-5-hydroxy-6-metoxy-1,4-benzoquinol methylase
MSLREAQPVIGDLPPLPQGPPYLCVDLDNWAGISFFLPTTDDRLIDIHNGEPAPTPPLSNLEGMVRLWREHPEWMSFLDPDSPVFEDKKIERALYIDFWDKALKDNSRVLDLGGGVGRMSMWALSKNCTVELVDPDLRSLWRAVSSSGGSLGSIDVHWSTGERMMALNLGVFDAVIACEVLNYVEDQSLTVNNILNSLKPGGTLLLSVEARWGWAMSTDVAEGSIENFFDNGIVHVPNDRYIHTHTQESLKELLKDFHLIDIQPSHYAFSGPFEMASGPRPIKDAIALEKKLRKHPISKNLNRAWMVIAQKPKE